MFFKHYIMRFYEEYYELEKHDYYYKTLFTTESYLKKSIGIYLCSVFNKLKNSLKTYTEIQVDAIEVNRFAMKLCVLK